MLEYCFSLKDRKQIAEGTEAFWLDTSISDFSFKAGQFVNLTLISPPYPDEKTNTRAFSIASSPHHKDFFMIAMRIRESGFKKSLLEMPLGTKIKVLGPFGHFNLHENASIPVVFLAGGIGITPMLSMIEWATHEKLSHQLYLFYANRNPGSTAFLRELNSLSQENPNLKIIPTITESEDPAWKYEKGAVNQNLLSKCLVDLHKPIYYIAGPPGMVQATQDMLLAIGIEQNQVVTEKFGGY